MSKSTSLKSLLARHETVLVLVILVEVVLFQTLGRNFLIGRNISNVFRHSVEIGLLAVAMTPVILTGGIDLSVGSMMGLCAVLFGMMVNSLGVDPWVAGLAAVGFGALGGGVIPNRTAHRPIIEPTDRSIPPVRITGVMATASRPISTE